MKHTREMENHTVQLGELLIVIRNGSDAEQFEQPIDDSMLPISRIETISDGTVDFSRVKYAKVSPEHRAKYLLQSGDILFSHINSPEHIAKTAIYRSEIPLIHGINLLLLRPDQRVCHPEYLNYYFKSNNVRLLFRARCKKAVNQASLNQGDISELDVPLPSIPEQRRIAARLGQADRLRWLRRYADQVRESYLQSVFVEMFGEPIRNEKKWGLATIADLGEVQTGNTPSRDEPENYGRFIEWIKSDNILDNDLYLSQSREMLSEIGLKKGRCVEAGGVMMTCIAGSLSHIGDVAVTNRKVAFNQQINAISSNHDVNPLFLYGMLKIAKPYIQHKATTGMKHIITKSKLEELVMIKPPLAEQERFASIVLRYERLRAQQREAGRQAELLFQGLLANAFGHKQ
jgi:type I restriction enzyme S subunit